MMRHRPHTFTTSAVTAGTSPTGNVVILGQGALQFVATYDPDDLGDVMTPCTVTLHLKNIDTGEMTNEVVPHCWGMNKWDAEQDAWDRINPKYREQEVIVDGSDIEWLKEASRKTAHVSEDSSVVSHCVFCGSGAIVSRGDGGVECTLCNRSFSVMEQPLYSNMPSPDQGANIEATPFDPLMQEDAFDPGQQPLQQPGNPAQPQPGQQPQQQALPQAPAQPNPFAMKSMLRARNGTVLDQEDFILHHAIRIARGE